MATVGQQLTAPEAGYRRYNDSDSRIIKNTSENSSTSTYGQDYTLADVISFRFFGSKLSLITGYANGYRCKNLAISIDGNIERFNQDYNLSTYQILCYEKYGLDSKIHEVKIYTDSQTVPATINGNIKVDLDAIDIDSTGYLVHPTLNQVSNLLGMAEGDCIPCRYTATTSGQAGYFSELGICIADEIPVTGTATPDGLFYFVKTAKGTLVADRVIQTGISWDVLNSAKFIEGTIFISNIVPVMTSSISTVCSISQSSQYNIYGGWKAFDGINKPLDIWDCGEGIYSGWLRIDFIESTIINSYYLYCQNYSSYQNRAPKNWTFEASNDGDNWVILDTQTNQTNWILGVAKQYIFKNNTPYNKYRINITSDNGANRLSIGEFGMGNIYYLIRSLSGGCAYADANGNKSTTDCSKGAWPNNEWDKYIVNSDLGGTIIPGDDNIWHWSTGWTWVKDTILTGINTTGVTSSNTSRTQRGNNVTNNPNRMTYNTSTVATATGGFRPVLEFIEQDSKQTNLWY